MADIEKTMARMDLEAELIALVEAHTARFPGIVVRFVPSPVDGKPAPIEPKCNCRATPGKIVFCHCLCPTEPQPFGATYRRGANASEAA